MRPVRVKQPEELLRLAATTAEQLDKPIDVLYAEAIERYIEVTKHATAGALRSRLFIPRKSPYVSIEIPEELFERAEKLAERLEKTRDVLYADALAKALAKLVARAPAADSALNQGHDLPSGAWRPVGPTNKALLVARLATIHLKRRPRITEVDRVSRRLFEWDYASLWRTGQGPL